MSSHKESPGRRESTEPAAQALRADWHVALFAGIVCALASGSAIAQTQSGSAAVPARDSEAMVEEIIITARKRSERLEDIAESISVFTAADIEAARIEGIKDIAMLTPGLYFSGDWSPSVSTLTVRGVTNNPTGDAPVAFVIDGVAYGNSYLIGQSLFDIAQIEVLKGPQGSLYGRNSIGGAINVTTRAPTNEWTGQFTLTGGNGDLAKVRGGIYGPIIRDKLLIGVSATAQNFDGIIFNEFRNKPVDFKRGAAGRVRLLYTPTDNMSVDFAYTHLDYRTGSTYWAANNIPPALGFPNGVIQGADITVADLTANDYAGKFDYQTSYGRVTAIANYQKVEAPRTVDIDFIPLKFTSVLTSPDTAETKMAELRFTSPDERSLRWILGGFYQEQERVRAQNVSVNTNPVKTPGQERMVLALRIPTDQPSRLQSVFGQAEYDLSQQWQILAGLRYDSDRREDKIGNLARTFTAVTPKVTLSYKPGSRSHLYATYSEGYRAGGYNPTAVFGRVYEPETLKNYELGLKARSETGLFSFSGAAYFQDYDQQQFYVFSSAAASQALINSKKSEAKGVELELRLTPIDGLELIAGGNFVDTKIKDFGTFRAFAGITEADINGKKLLYTPAYTANLTAQYSWQVNALQASVRADFIARGKIYWGFDNIENQPATQIVNGRIGVGNDTWTVSAYSENLFDKQYDTFCFVGRFIGNANRINPCAHAEPRSYGAEFSYRF